MYNIFTKKSKKVPENLDFSVPNAFLTRVSRSGERRASKKMSPTMSPNGEVNI